MAEQASHPWQGPSGDVRSAAQPWEVGFDASELETQANATWELEQQVAKAQAELEEYQRLLNDLPGIYEDKFRQAVRSLAQNVRNVLDERNALQAQVSRALVLAQERQALHLRRTPIPASSTQQQTRWHLLKVAQKPPASIPAAGS